MSTQTDFVALVVRINAATDRLEMDVMELERLINDAEGAVSEELTLLVAQARAAANSAQMSAQTATQAANSASTSNNNAAIEANRAAAQVTLAQAEVTKATAQVQLAKDEVTKATTQANRAKTEADRAQTIATSLLASAPFQEAPEDGRTYGRKDAAWVAVEGGGSGGTGTVTSVNGVAPDNAGNVSLTIPTNTNQLTNGAGFITLAEVPSVSVPTKTSELQNDSGFITAADIPAPPVVPTKTSQLQNDSNFATTSQLPTKTSQLTNDSSFITLAQVPAPAIATDAPADGKQYARKDNAWSEVESSGGSSLVPFEFTTPAMLGINPNSARVCFNYALYNVIKAKGGYFWNDPATINPVNTDANWMTPATYNPAPNSSVAIDIRCFRVYSLDGTTGAVKGHSGATWNGTAWVPNNAFLGIVGQIVGQFSDTVISSSSMSAFLPVGKWFYPSIVQDFTSGNNKQLPTTQIKVNHALVTKTSMQYGGSPNYPFGVYDAFDLIWLPAAGVASKGQYYYQRSTDSWINVGLGTQ